MNKNNLQDVTFLIPLRIDSKVRLENLILVLDFLLSSFDTNIILLEADRYPSSFLKSLLPNDVRYEFYKDEDPIFHRTAHINYMLKMCQTPIVAVWDADVLVLPKQVIESVEALRSGEAHFASPYSGLFLDTSDILREQYLENKDISYLIKHQNKMQSLYTKKAVGGGFLANTSDYLASGGENERFYGWGIEDGERVNRWVNLGYKFKRIEGVIFHLSHERNKNSMFHNKHERAIKLAELHRIASMSKEDLEADIKTWAWVNS